MVKSSAVLINTSRGEVIDQNVLINFLLDKKIAGAALDVLEKEPNPLNKKLKKAIRVLKNKLIVTPHIAGYTKESLTKVEMYLTKVSIKKIKNI